MGCTYCLPFLCKRGRSIAEVEKLFTNSIKSVTNYSFDVPISVSQTEIDMSPSVPRMFNKTPICIDRFCELDDIHGVVNALWEEGNERYPNNTWNKCVLHQDPCRTDHWSLVVYILIT